MKAVGNYNNISPELQKAIPELSGLAVFQMLNGVPNPDSEERARRPMLYGKKQLLTKFKIRDPHSRKLVDIALAEDWDDKGQPTKAKLFIPEMGAIHGTGFFSLQEGNVEDEELFEVLYISPEREGSPCADANVTPVFKLVNKAEEGKAKTGEINELRKALETASKLTAEEAKDFMASLNQSFDTDAEANVAVNEYARKNPSLFIKTFSDPNTKLKSEIKTALDKGIIVFDAATRKVTVGESELFKLDNETETLEGIASWVNSASNGKKVLEGVRKQLKGNAAS